MKLIRKLFGFFWDKSLLTFLIIGGVNTVLSSASMFLLAKLFPANLWGVYFSMLIPFAVFSVPSFYFNRKYSFESKAPLGPSILRFSVIIAVCFHLSFFANNLFLPWLRRSVFPGISDNWYAVIRILCVQVVFTLLNYVGQRMWAFKSTEKSEPPSEP